MATMLEATASLHDRQIAAAQKSADRLVELLTKVGDSKPTTKLTDSLHKVTDPIQKATEKVTEPFTKATEKATEPLHKVTEPVVKFVGTREEMKAQFESNANDWAEFRKDLKERIRGAVKQDSKARTTKKAAPKATVVTGKVVPAKKTTATRRKATTKSA